MVRERATVWTEEKPTRGISARIHICGSGVDPVKKGGMLTEKDPAGPIPILSRIGKGTIPTPSILRGGEAESTRNTLFQLPHPLTDDTDNPVVPEPVLVDATTSSGNSDILRLPQPNHFFGQWRELRTPSRLSNLSLRGLG